MSDISKGHRLGNEHRSKERVLGSAAEADMAVAVTASDRQRPASIPPSRGPGTYTGHSSLEPYGLECIAAAVADRGWSVRLAASQGPGGRPVVYAKVEPGLYLFSSFTSDHDDVVAVAERVKREQSDAIVVLGGHHASGLRSLAATSPFDYVVVGEGEDSVCDLLDALGANSRPATDIPGVIATAQPHQQVKERPRIPDLDRLPFAIRDGNTLQSSRVYALAYPPPSAQTAVAQISYSRGCPFSCPFCASPQTWGREVHWRSPGQVAREARGLSDQHGVNLLFFSDLTFNLSEGRVLVLCDEFERQGVDVAWFAMCGFDGTSPDTFHRMAASGCTKIGWGIEAVTNDSLSRVKTHQSLDTIMQTLQAADAAGIINRAYLMMGYPWQTRSELEDSLGTLTSLPIDEIKMSFYTPFPGTPAYEEYQARLRTQDLSLFDTDHPILDTVDMKAEDLIEVRQSLFSRFYGSQAYDLRCIFRPKVHTDSDSK
jgi:radical SAM superfamily enzyme YgiQ (UPF0313 family)